MRYHSQVVLATGEIGQPASHVFSANGMFDPDITGVGHQPRGFDEVMALFDHYTVISSTMSATFLSVLNVGVLVDTKDQMVGISLRDQAAEQTTAEDIMEDRAISFAGISAFRGAVPVRRSKSFSPKAFLGISHPMSEVAVRGNAAANPVEQAYFHVWAAPQNGIDNAGAVQVSIDIIYTAVFTEPKNPGES